MDFTTDVFPSNLNDIHSKKTVSLNLIQEFIETEGWLFSVESTKIENVTFPYKTARSQCLG